ncbi:MAG: uracil-DNA glycosylase family protein [Hyphomicrobiales bacterium]|nr:uracil-DNA glycosylase family protein [Hyphomicrobiales bacterium]MBV8769979.1 uracil-DNA glycosylase family protein [Hyphomicrobiales bacterium]MBV9053138.1 uracil-DNA glycosylase family protein [Hyphomicrobiales bacterium]
MTVASLDELLRELAACRICRDAPLQGRALPHEPRPVIQASPSARLCIASQAPGTRVHVSGRPFTDASGKRLRAWLGLDEQIFYDARRVAIVPMGHCFPGQDAKGADLPPRRECAPAWRQRIFAELPALELILLIGQYAQTWHLGDAAKDGLTATVGRWREILEGQHRPALLPLPHPSWRNNGWLKNHPWFETQLVPQLRKEVRRLTEVRGRAASADALVEGAQLSPSPSRL